MCGMSHMHKCILLCNCDSLYFFVVVILARAVIYTDDVIRNVKQWQALTRTPERLLRAVWITKGVWMTKQKIKKKVYLIFTSPDCSDQRQTDIFGSVSCFVFGLKTFLIMCVNEHKYLHNLSQVCRKVMYSLTHPKLTIIITTLRAMHPGMAEDPRRPDWACIDDERRFSMLINTSGCGGWEAHQPCPWRGDADEYPQAGRCAKGMQKAD